MHLVDLFFASYVVALAYGIGGRILRRIRPPNLNNGEKAIFSIGIGLGIIAYLVFFLGIAGLLNKWAILTLLLFLTVLSLRRINLKLRPNLRDFPLELLVLIPCIIAVLLPALSPPFDWDGLAYHLAVPKLYLKAHKIYWIKFIHHSNFPFLMEMLYTIPLSLGLIDACKLFHLAFAFLIVSLLYLQGRKFGRIAGLIALVFPLQTTLFLWESTIAYNDLAFAFYVLFALVAFLNEQMLLAGIAVGFALGTKHLALSYLLAFSLLLPFFRKGSLRKFPSLLVPALLLPLPWYLKSYIYTGNPVYPFFYSIFDGKLWNAEAAEAYRQAQLSMGMGRGITSFLLLPWNLTFHPDKFFDPGANPYFVLLSPLFLAFIPLIVFEPFFMVFFFLSTLQWFLLSQNIRYFLPVIVSFPIPVVKNLMRFWKKPFSLLFLSLIFISYIFHLSLFSLMFYPTWRVALGLESREDFLSRVFQPYPVYEFVNENLPKNSKIALLGEPRGFYLDRDYIWADPGHHTMIPYDKFKDLKDLIEGYKRLGITHIIINRIFAPGNSSSGKVLDKFLSNPLLCPYTEL
ncbi:MAG: hypothetical protein ACP5QS_07930, partial [bacterium]